MLYQEISPDHRLRPYVKCYYTYESGISSAFADTVFPSGCMEVIFNLGTGSWQTAAGNGFITTPAIELWGQLLQPLPIRSLGSNTMLGIRFFPHGAACLLDEQLDRFNDQVTDAHTIIGRPMNELHSRLLETAGWPARIALIEQFLLQRFSTSARRLQRLAVVGDILQELRQPDTLDNIRGLASRYGISQRYLQKLFVQYTGLTPKLYSKINRFQQSLKLVTRNKTSLTSIAYDCGYFDQSHFIREFKSFTGLTPSGYLHEGSPVTQAVANA